ncbi:hypothetical protein [Aquamicrobium zhengzhouense]|nr:hypothetical protein [Aquamicrobium zhengzhouense]
MTIRLHHIEAERIAVKPSARTRHSELLILCARIGYSPPSFD